MFLSKQRNEIICPPIDTDWKQSAVLPLLRTAIECACALDGAISLHSACVEKDGKAICFTAPSGTGKSTRAATWKETLGADIISGDRPMLYFSKKFFSAYGVPWDGKEKIYRNVNFPLKTICYIVRSDKTYAHILSKENSRRLLMQQCFIPLWDPDAAVAIMATVNRLISEVPIIKLYCGPDGKSAKDAYEIIYNHPERITEEFI